MGRKPLTPDSVPHLRVRHRWRKTFYYYDHGGKPRHEEPLGSDYAKAIKRWAEIEGEPTERVASVVTFRYVADLYRAEIIPTKAPATQKDNLRELTKLLEFFDDPPGPLDAIEPVHISQYIRWRRQAPVRANREKALFSHIWNWSRSQGFTAKANPCAGVEGNEEHGRTVYVEEEDYRATWNKADIPLRDAMDLAYLTGQRPSDTLRADERDLKDGYLYFRQSKRGAALRIVVEGELASVLSRIAKRKASLVVRSTRLVINEHGQPLTLRALQQRFANARAAACTNFQFRDLRAKAATDKADTQDIRQAQRQLGHSSVVTTEHYIRNRRGDKVTPTR